MASTKGRLLQHPRSLVLQTIHESTGVAATDISRRTGMNPVSVKHHVDRLIREGRIQKVGTHQQGRGRPREILKPNPRSGYIVGVDMDPTRTIAIVTDMARNVIASAERPLESAAPAAKIMDTLIDVVRGAISASRVADSKIIGLGFAVTGFLNREAGVAVMSSTLPNWRNVPVRFLLQEAFADHPVLIDDSVTCSTLAEKWFGKGVGVRDFISLRVRTGLSIGVVVNGELYRGIGNAGTVNDLYVQPRRAEIGVDAPRMLFELASGHAIIQRLRREARPRQSPELWRLVGGDPEQVGLDEVIAAAASRDPLCVSVLQDAARCWARAIARVYELLHPSKAIFCGAFAGLTNIIRTPLEDSLREEIYPALRDQIVLEFSELGPEAGALGAAALVLQQHINSSVA